MVSWLCFLYLFFSQKAFQRLKMKMYSVRKWSCKWREIAHPGWENHQTTACGAFSMRGWDFGIRDWVLIKFWRVFSRYQCISSQQQPRCNDFHHLHWDWQGKLVWFTGSLHYYSHQLSFPVTEVRDKSPHRGLFWHVFKVTWCLSFPRSHLDFRIFREQKEAKIWA